MTYPIAMIPYANMAPYREAGVPKGCAFLPLVPSASVGALRAGQVLGAAVPVAALPALGDRVQPIGRFGIAARESSLSVLLFSNVPFEEINDPDAIQMTRESTTSIRLLQLLLSRHQQKPKTTSRPKAPSGELIIGDRALCGLYRWKQREAQDPDFNRFQQYGYVTDLACEWYATHGLPFVFARWVVRTDAPAGCRTALENWLNRFQEKEKTFIERAIPKTVTATCLPEDLIERYFKVIRRSLTTEDLAGQSRFLDHLDQKTGVEADPEASAA